MDRLRKQRRWQGVRCYRSVDRNAETGRAVAESETTSGPAPAEARHVVRLIADLDSEEFTVRQKARAELRRLGERAEAELRKALNGKPTLEARKRIEELLESISASYRSPQKLREFRALEVLEHIGTSEAQAVLRTLADGAAEASLTCEAKASLRRLSERRHPKP